MVNSYFGIMSKPTNRQTKEEPYVIKRLYCSVSLDEARAVKLLAVKYNLTLDQFVANAINLYVETLTAKENENERRSTQDQEVGKSN